MAAAACVLLPRVVRGVVGGERRRRRSHMRPVVSLNQKLLIDTRTIRPPPTFSLFGVFHLADTNKHCILPGHAVRRSELQLQTCYVFPLDLIASSVRPDAALWVTISPGVPDNSIPRSECRNAARSRGGPWAAAADEPSLCVISSNI